MSVAAASGLPAGSLGRAAMRVCGSVVLRSPFPARFLTEGLAIAESLHDSSDGEIRHSVMPLSAARSVREAGNDHGAHARQTGLRAS